MQIVGYEGSAKRIDTAAAALWNRMTVEEMAALDLAYAPPFARISILPTLIAGDLWWRCRLPHAGPLVRLLCF